MVQKGQNPQGSPTLSWTGFFFLLRDIGSNGNDAVENWLAELNDPRHNSSSQLDPNPQEMHLGLITVPKESHMYSGSLLFINLTCAQRAAAQTDFFNQIMYFRLNDLVSTHFLFLSCCTRAICV